MIRENERRSRAVLDALHPFLEVIQQAKHLTEYRALYMKIVRDHELMSRQSKPEGIRALWRLRRMVQNAFALELLSFWELDNRTPEKGLNLPASLFRAQLVLDEYPDLLTFPLLNGTQSLAGSALRLQHIISIVHGSRRYQRLRNFRDKYVAHKLSRTKREIKSKEIDLPTYEDLDRIFAYSMVAIRELSNSVYPTAQQPKEWIAQGQIDQSAMLRALNRKLGKRMPPKD